MTIAELASRLHVSDETARKVRGLIVGTIDYREHPAVVAWAEQCYNDPRESRNARAECILCAVNAELDGYGVEAIEGRYLDRYHGNIQASYVNLGDTYTTTILHDHMLDRFRVTSWGDWVESHPKRTQEGA